jgi:hypothetical protein
MSCPRCGSQDLWDDNLSWGCNHCGWMMSPDGPSMLLARDLPGLPRHLKDIPTPTRVIRVEKINPDNDDEVNIDA